jgi:hypothetical protein
MRRITREPAWKPPPACWCRVWGAVVLRGFITLIRDAPFETSSIFTVRIFLYRSPVGHGLHVGKYIPVDTEKQLRSHHAATLVALGRSRRPVMFAPQ